MDAASAFILFIMYVVFSFAAAYYLWEWEVVSNKQAKSLGVRYNWQMTLYLVFTIVFAIPLFFLIPVIVPFKYSGDVVKGFKEFYKWLRQDVEW